MFVIIGSDGNVRKIFKGTDAATVIELALEFQCDNDLDYSKRLAESRRLLQEDPWVS